MEATSVELMIRVGITLIAFLFGFVVGVQMYKQITLKQIEKLSDALVKVSKR